MIKGNNELLTTSQTNEQLNKFKSIMEKLFIGKNPDLENEKYEILLILLIDWVQKNTQYITITLLEEPSRLKIAVSREIGRRQLELFYKIFGVLTLFRLDITTNTIANTWDSFLYI